MRRVWARFRRRSKASSSTAVSFGISGRSCSVDGFALLEVFLTIPVVLPSLCDSFPAVLAVKGSLRRGSAAPLTAAGRRESAPPRREGRIEKAPIASVFINSPPRNAVGLAEIAPQTTHQTAVPSSLLPSPRGEPLARGSAECCGVDRRPPTIPAAGDGPARSDTESPVL